MMLRLKAVQSAGLFDPKYFLYYEEVDLLRALARLGWQTWHVEDARLIHLGGAATGLQHRQERRRLPAYWYHSWQYYMRKNHGRAYALIASVLWIVGATINLGIARLRGKVPAAPLNLVSDLWFFAMRPLFGLKAGKRD